jgi:hypothetical protein
MPLNNSIDDLDPDLALTYAEAKTEWKRDYPQGPWPELNETARSAAVQNAYYARTRQPVATVQALYKVAGLYAIEAKEAASWATNAKFGQSAHNAGPGEYAGAFDVRMRELVPSKPATATSPAVYVAGKSITWDAKYYIAFAAYMLRAAGQLKAAGKISDKIVWGGDWNQNGKTTDEHRPDFPHYERLSWRKGRRKKTVTT